MAIFHSYVSLPEGNECMIPARFNGAPSRWSSTGEKDGTAASNLSEKKHPWCPGEMSTIYILHIYNYIYINPYYVYVSMYACLIINMYAYIKINK